MMTYQDSVCSFRSLFLYRYFACEQLCLHRQSCWRSSSLSQHLKFWKGWLPNISHGRKKTKQIHFCHKPKYLCPCQYLAFTLRPIQTSVSSGLFLTWQLHPITATFANRSSNSPCRSSLEVQTKSHQSNQSNSSLN